MLRAIVDRLGQLVGFEARVPALDDQVKELSTEQSCSRSGWVSHIEPVSKEIAKEALLV